MPVPATFDETNSFCSIQPIVGTTEPVVKKVGFHSPSIKVNEQQVETPKIVAVPPPASNKLVAHSSKSRPQSDPISRSVCQDPCVTSTGKQKLVVCI